MSEKKSPIYVTKSSMPKYEEFIEAIKPIWDSAWLTNMGEFHNQLNQKLMEYLGVKKLSLFVNGHMALELTLQAFELEGEVITTPFTFASTTHAIARNNLTPVFCDINEDDYTIDVKKLENLITDKTSAIVPVHVYGNICNIDEIDRIAKKYNLKVIYDGAHAFGETLNGVGIGNFGDATMFSFHATKVFNTIEGGAVAFREERIETLLYYLKNFGITGEETVEFIGGNAKMNEFQAVMGVCNLMHIEEEVAKRKAVVDKYEELLSGIEGIRLNVSQQGIKRNYAYFPVVFEGYKKNRDEIYNELASHNIFPRKYFYPLTNSFECYKSNFQIQETPVAERIAGSILTLPCYADLALEDVERICSIIKEG
ncbi:DegT/DnrJ/EryC1/StrS family aminotransferase [Anaerosacchariphilus polymeriproducens]|uniref:DegT/DnrJ/EryC1/StrS family aminotransferase n=1 Tax=Anaerosacchariphilus polymeriproducens TaxID=1812858 RepID=A0A371AY07_9FIRM|nr:DegT/DnrJ/EryC1/StrS family aminotransferase [Anaerosacchariphilus polymeriproducens]RDU24437.1 DegT/DnrJ/EryC1/StrS family aminotransferase [Anaerosacchariphilus polymeriproducens]